MFSGWCLGCQLKMDGKNKDVPGRAGVSFNIPDIYHGAEQQSLPPVLLSLQGWITRWCFQIKPGSPQVNYPVCVLHNASFITSWETWEFSKSLRFGGEPQPQLCVSVQAWAAFDEPIQIISTLICLFMYFFLPTRGHKTCLKHKTDNSDVSHKGRYVTECY